MLRILWNDHLIKGSPYRMTCRQKRVPVDHTRVRCHGPGLQQSKVSQLSEFFIDGSQAGPGKSSSFLSCSLHWEPTTILCTLHTILAGTFSSLMPTTLWLLVALLVNSLTLNPSCLFSWTWIVFIQNPFAGVPNLRMSGVKSDIMVTLIPQGNNIYKAVFTPDIAGM